LEYPFDLKATDYKKPEIFGHGGIRAAAAETIL
jgi:hypothetical protein